MPWLQLRIPVTPEQAPEREEFLFTLGALSVTFMDAEDQPIFEPDLGTTPLWQHTSLLALFEADTDEQNLRQEVEKHIGDTTLQVEHIADQDWERSWMEDFHPVCCGTRLWIVPSWHQPPDPSAVNLSLDPGLAFGTGTHPTTALCLEWLDAQSLKDRTLVDFGCGSGILAIAALLLGARNAIGTDIDPQALEASRQNARRNRIADQALDLCLPPRMPAKQADVVVANILASPLVQLAPQLAALVKPGGLLALSGILEEQADEVCSAYRPQFDLDALVSREGWVRISGRKSS